MFVSVGDLLGIPSVVPLEVVLAVVLEVPLEVRQRQGM